MQDTALAFVPSRIFRWDNFSIRPRAVAERMRALQGCHRALLRCGGVRTLSGASAPVKTLPAPLLAERACVSRAIGELTRRGILDASCDANTAVVYDLDRLDALRGALSLATPDHWTHAFAIKASPLARVLEGFVDAGFGLEAASLTEVKMAFSAGCPPGRVVFDSPAKTHSEIEYALSHGVLLNCNSLEELERQASVREDMATKGSSVHPASRVGLRVNPLVGSGGISALSVSTKRSKFGVSDRDAVVAAFRRRPELRALHVHTGSQGMSIEQLAGGVACIAGVLDAIEAECGVGRVDIVDIGGGLSANYSGMGDEPSFKDYISALRSARGCESALFDAGRVQSVVTEFGKALVTKAAFVVSSVEYIGGGDPTHPTAITHAGADLFVRTAYQPNNFPHRFSAHAPDGAALERAELPHDITGPLCFGGDVLARSLTLPRLEPGDWVAVHDCGANTFSLWSRHCSRRAPPVIGVRGLMSGDEGSRLDVSVLKEGETDDDVMSFWR